MYKRIVLDNGLRIILAPKAESQAVTVLVLVEAGSKYETKEINGLSHFLEHMCFKGTEKRPKAIDISQELDAIGAEYNAFTGQEYTGYYAKVEKKHVEKILEVVSDIYLNSTFPEKEIEKERGVIIEEINMYEDLPMRRVGELFTTLLYGDQPAGWDIAGRKEVIKVLKRDDFINYREKHYVAKGTAVIIAGNFNEEEIVSRVKEKFSSVSLDKKGGKEKTTEEQKEPKAMVYNKKSDQTHLIVGVRAFSIFDERRKALSVISEVLGGGMSSRLFQKVRDELGAAYYVRAEADLFTDHGYFGVAAGIDNKRIKEVTEAILGEFRKLKEEEVPETELNKVRDRISGKQAISLETSDDLAEFFGIQEVLQKEIETPEEMVEEIRKVGQKEIKELANEIFKEENLNMALIGPFEKDFEEEIKGVLKL
ncbi:MAG: pitrilysin family protein [Candidatus Paceibacterota bacterium]